MSASCRSWKTGAETYTEPNGLHLSDRNKEVLEAQVLEGCCSRDYVSNSEHTGTARVYLSEESRTAVQNTPGMVVKRASIY